MGTARLDRVRARCSTEGHGETQQGMVQQTRALYNSSGHGQISRVRADQQGTARLGRARRSTVGHGETQQGMCSSVGYGQINRARRG